MVIMVHKLKTFIDLTISLKYSFHHVFRQHNYLKFINILLSPNEKNKIQKEKLPTSVSEKLSINIKKYTRIKP